MKILWLSPFAPYDKVGHGGGQNHNYYLKYIKKNTNFDITLLSVCNKNEKEKLDLDQYGIDNIIKVYDKKLLKNMVRVIFGKFFINRDGGLFNTAKYYLLIEALLEYLKRNEYPDVIIMQWFEATELIDILKKYFPKSRYIAIEEDVAFLGFQRKYEESHGIYKNYKKIKYIHLKKLEMTLLQKCDVVVTLNEKDKNILIKEGMNKNIIFNSCAYYSSFQNCIYDPDKSQLLFYGAMSRIENYKSVIWFIEKVMPLLDSKYKLVIVGANPSKKALKYESKRIHFTGFVESVQPYFENSLCLVSPLLLGAGIKIKVLEALSAGLPVITNAIGAEGIDLTDRENYLHAELPMEYVNAINSLSSDDNLRMKLSVNGQEHISKNFNVIIALDKLIDKIKTFG